jgi:hypothetical protein
MAYSSGLHTFDQVLNKIMLQAKKRAGRATLAELLVDGIRNVNLSFGEEGVKWDKMTPGDINDIDFPSDFEDFVALGVPVHGQLWFLTKKGGIIRTTTTVLGQETQDSDEGEGVGMVTNAIQDYYTRGGVNKEGYYTIDYTNRRILLNSVTKSQVILVYKVSGVTTDATPYIPSKYIPYLTSYVLWNNVRYVEGDERRAQYLEEQYMRESLRLQDSTVPPLYELYDAIASTYTQLPKR